MSEALDQETNMWDLDATETLNEVIRHANQARIDKPKGRPLNGLFYCKPFRGNLAITIYPLQNNRYIAYLYDHPNLHGEHFAGEQVIPHAEAWVLKYDSQHTRWSVEAWNTQIGAERFRQYLHLLNADYALKITTIPLVTP